MKATRYFTEQVLHKRPYIEPAQCLSVIAAPLRREAQPDGRIRHWGRILDHRDGKSRIPRVITLDDGETLHNAFHDRNFQDPPP